MALVGVNKQFSFDLNKVFGSLADKVEIFFALDGTNFTSFIQNTVANTVFEKFNEVMLKRFKQKKTSRGNAWKKLSNTYINAKNQAALTGENIFDIGSFAKPTVSANASFTQTKFDGSTKNIGKLTGALFESLTNKDSNLAKTRKAFFRKSRTNIGFFVTYDVGGRISEYISEGEFNTFGDREWLADLNPEEQLELDNEIANRVVSFINTQTIRFERTIKTIQETNLNFTGDPGKRKTFLKVLGEEIGTILTFEINAIFRNVRETLKRQR